MSLPKNFSTTNKENRQKALDSLEWFIYHYDYELTDKYAEYVKVSEEWGNPVTGLGTHRCYADTEEKAINMFYEYMNSTYIKQNKLKSYKLVYKNCDDGNCAIKLALN
jgi:hypothetical protein|tara:strand:+ start:56 stop:379 length:324 start_codon:yes stop_codon:yes gene_type:complete